MKEVYEILITMGANGSRGYTSVMGKKEPVAHPCNCKCECPYGYGRAMCFPCMERILHDHQAGKRNPVGRV